MKLKTKSHRFLQNNYAFFEKGVQAIIDKTSGRYLPADVYRETTSTSMTVFWVFGNENLCGFTCVDTYIARFSKEKVLSVPMIYLDNKEPMSKKLNKEIEKLAQTLECDVIEGNSPRKGGLRELNKFGYAMDAVIYQKEVSYG